MGTKSTLKGVVRAFFKGMGDALWPGAMIYCVTSPIIRRRVLQCLTLNGVLFLGSIMLLHKVVLPLSTLLFGSALRLSDDTVYWITLTIDKVLKTVWILPLYVFSFILNSLWYQDIAEQANLLYTQSMQKQMLRDQQRRTAHKRKHGKEENDKKEKHKVKHKRTKHRGSKRRRKRNSRSYTYASDDDSDDNNSSTDSLFQSDSSSNSSSSSGSTSQTPPSWSDMNMHSNSDSDKYLNARRLSKHDEMMSHKRSKKRERKRKGKGKGTSSSKRHQSGQSGKRRTSSSAKKRSKVDIFHGILTHLNEEIYHCVFLVVFNLEIVALAKLGTLIGWLTYFVLHSNVVFVLFQSIGNLIGFLLFCWQHAFLSFELNDANVLCIFHSCTFFIRVCVCMCVCVVM